VCPSIVNGPIGRRDQATSLWNGNVVAAMLTSESLHCEGIGEATMTPGRIETADRQPSGLVAYALWGAAFGLVIGLLFGQAAYAVAFAALGGVIIGLDMWLARNESPNDRTPAVPRRTP
jgi:hypothetical protein